VVWIWVLNPARLGRAEVSAMEPGFKVAGYREKVEMS